METYVSRLIERTSATCFTACDIVSSLSSADVTAWLSPFLVGLMCLIVSTYALRAWSASSYGPVGYHVPVPEQCAKDWEGQVLEQPSIKTPGNGLVTCYCPANGKLLGKVSPASPDDIDAAIAVSAAAQSEWKNTSFDDRRKVLRSLQKYIISHQDKIMTAACLDSGKTKIDAALGEILVTVEKIKWLLKHGEKALQPDRREVSFPLMVYKKAEVRYEPLGVVCACVSWNYPFHNLLSPIVSSIFAGNGIVVKGSEQTAWSSQYFASIVKGALAACGHNPDLVQSIACWPSSASYLTSHPGIAHITFIGSRPVAYHVTASAAKVLTPVCVELGGKDAAIILDAPSGLPALSSILMRGVFQSCGQNCVGIERVIALPAVYSKLVSILEPRVRDLRLGSILEDGNMVDCGAMISDANFDALENMIATAVKQGARCLIGGKRYNHPTHPKGHYFTPTLLVDVTPEMEIAQNEVFGPVCLLMKAATVDDAIRIANSTEYGLGCSVFGKRQQDLDRVVREIKSGMISVNDFAVYYLNQSLPFGGGVRGSGYGRFAGAEGLRSVSNLKAVCVDRFPKVASTAIPPVVDYPIADGERGWRFTKGLVELGYAGDLMGKIGGIWKLIK